MEQEEGAKSTERGRAVEILSGLWIGSLASLRYLASDNEDLSPASRHTWAVISVLDSEKLLGLANAFLEPMKRSKQCRQHVVWKISDKTSADFLSERLQSMLMLMDESRNQQRHILVHCAMGVSRSAALCAAWLIARKQMSLQQAMDTIRLVRPEVCPNLGFIASLRALEGCDGDIDKARIRLERKNDLE
jgi:protein-tyrosine phosphatase